MNKHTFQQSAVFILFWLSALTCGCGIPRSSDADEDISLPTEIGVPNGQASKMTIGSKGGAISSDDGKIKLVIPPDLLASDIEFSIQPITNKTEGDVGSAYRLEPNGQKFEQPVTLSFNFADGDLQGAEPASLAVAYQDGEGRWRSLETLYIDEAGKSITALTTHFTDVVVKKGSWWIGDPDKHRDRWEGKKRAPPRRT